MSTSTSRFTWYCGTELPGEVMAAELEQYRFEPHFHDAWSIGAIAEGCCSFSCDGQPHSAAEGELVIIPPRVVHTGGTSLERLRYGMAYIEPAWFDRHAALMYGGSVRFADVVIPDPALCEQWLALLTHEALGHQVRAQALSAALLALLKNHAARRGEAAGERDTNGGQTRPAPEPRGEASDVLRDLLARDGVAKADVETTARRFGIHRTTLVKQFSQRYGLPPEAWLRNWRVSRAKALMTAGAPLAQIAAETGFADQAHLTRVFKRIHGSAPGVLKKAFTQRPD